MGMPGRFEILQLKDSDWHAFKTLRLRALHTDPQAFSSPYIREASYPDETWQGWLQDANAGKDSWLFFARLDGELVGMTGAYRDENDRRTGAAQIYGMYLDPQARGHGIARALLDALLRRLAAYPEIARVHLAVNPAQQDAARLYQEAGFRIVGAPSVDTHGRQTIKMERVQGKPAGTEK
jgi:ribosomal protein S18 acetylase RimI-like enzyme